VPKAGGHSSWSTIGKDGIVVDLSALNGVSVDRDAMTVTARGGRSLSLFMPLFGSLKARKLMDASNHCRKHCSCRPCHSRQWYLSRIQPFRLPM
jgi:hypothetical protein